MWKGDFSAPTDLRVKGDVRVWDGPIRELAPEFLLAPYWHIWSVSYCFWVIRLAPKAFSPACPPIRSGYHDKYCFRRYHFVELQKWANWKQQVTPLLACMRMCMKGENIKQHIIEFGNSRPLEWQTGINSKDIVVTSVTHMVYLLPCS